MSKVTPPEYYICNYCGVTSGHYSYFKYTDNSGLNNICYDICNDECYEKHLKFLKTECSYNEKELKQHVKDFMWNNHKKLK